MFEPRDRGLLDFLATIVAVTAVYVGTPVGGLIERGFRQITGLGTAERSLVSYFEMAPEIAESFKPGAEIAGRPLSAPRDEDESLRKVVGRLPLDTALARAFAVVASGSVVTLDDRRTPWYDVKPLEHHVKDRVALGLEAPRVEGGPSLEPGLRDRLARSLDLLDAYRRRVGTDDAALAAYALGLLPVERALKRAKVLGEAEPGALGGFGRYLSRYERGRAADFVHAVQGLRTAYGMRWPVDRAFPITSPFGERFHPVLGGRRHHDGVDVGAPTGARIRTAAPGVVRFAGSDGVNGLYLQIDHGYGLRTAYCHASRLLVKTGERVAAGQAVAEVGSTGRSTGPHLHYGVFVGGRPVDPLVFRPPDYDPGFAVPDVEDPQRAVYGN